MAMGHPIGQSPRALVTCRPLTWIRVHPVNKQVLIQRIGYGLLAIVILCMLGSADAYIARAAEGWSGPLTNLWRQGSVICLTCLVVYLLAAREFTMLLRQKQARPWSKFAYLMVGLLIAAPWFASAGWCHFGNRKIDPALIPTAVLVVAILGASFAAVLRRRTEGALRDVSATWAIILYLGFLGSFSTAIRCGSQWPAGSGIWLLIILVLVTKASDIGAFLVGSAIGRHKLIPLVSPAKSVEGTIAGILCSGLLLAILTILIPLSSENGGYPPGKTPGTLGLVDALQYLSDGGSGLNSFWRIIRSAFLGMTMAVGAQFGDLVESCFKRDSQVKDSGNVMPRFGGMLDVMDSLIIALPIGWLLLTIVWPLPKPLQ